MAYKYVDIPVADRTQLKHTKVAVHTKNNIFYLTGVFKDDLYLNGYAALNIRRYTRVRVYVDSEINKPERGQALSIPLTDIIRIEEKKTDGWGSVLFTYMSVFISASAVAVFGAVK
jgi:hypothetical protein